MTVPARECEIKGEDREQEKRREIADSLVLSRPGKSLQNGAGFSEKTLKLVWRTCRVNHLEDTLLYHDRILALGRLIARDRPKLLSSF